MRQGAKFGMPSSNTITQLLMTYAAYDSRAQAASTDSTDYATSIKVLAHRATTPRPSDSSSNGAETATYSKRYEAARKDVELASAQKVKRKRTDSSSRRVGRGAGTGGGAL